MHSYLPVHNKDTAPSLRGIAELRVKYTYANLGSRVERPQKQRGIWSPSYGLCLNVVTTSLGKYVYYEIVGFFPIHLKTKVGKTNQKTPTKAFTLSLTLRK